MIRLCGAAVLVVALAACATTPAASVSAETSALPSRTPVTVTLDDSSFGPDISVRSGTTVVFLNGGKLKHTASHGKDGQLVENSLFDFVLEPGASASYTFETAGTYPITCIVHPTMNMTLTVE
jgi:plastocyanin